MTSDNYTDGSDHYDGAGDGQCLGLKNDGDRCTNGVYGSDYCCGIHKRARDVTLAPEADDRDWFKCPECGWQPAEWAGSGEPPACSWCGVEFPIGHTEWSIQADSSQTGGENDT